jgi:hypothetical protein
MGRNHFSQHGGPYFKNNGVSQHSHSHDDPNHIKPDKGLFLTIVISFSILLTIIASVLSSF